MRRDAATSGADISGCSAVGSAPALGAGGREFEPRHSDQKDMAAANGTLCLFFVLKIVI